VIIDAAACNKLEVELDTLITKGINYCNIPAPLFLSPVSFPHLDSISIRLTNLQYDDEIYKYDTRIIELLSPTYEDRIDELLS
jgi:hypothetical protein